MSGGFQSRLWRVGQRWERRRPGNVYWQRRRSVACGWLRGKELFRPAKVVVNDLRNGLAAGGGEANNKEKGQDHV